MYLMSERSVLHEMLLVRGRRELSLLSLLRGPGVCCFDQIYFLGFL